MKKQRPFNKFNKEKKELPDKYKIDQFLLDSKSYDEIRDNWRPHYGYNYIKTPRIH